MKAIDDRASAATVAALVDVALAVTREVRAEVRSMPRAGLSVSQVRALAYLDWRPGASLADVAEHLGLGAPSTSKLVEDLVGRGLMERARVPEDRRRIALRLTRAGAGLLAGVVRETHEAVAARLGALSDEEHATVSEALRLLRERLLPRREEER